MVWLEQFIKIVKTLRGGTLSNITANAAPCAQIVSNLFVDKRSLFNIFFSFLQHKSHGNLPRQTSEYDF